MEPPLPLAMRTALESGSCVLFLGAGIGWSAKDAKERPGPDSKALAMELAQEFNIAADGAPLAKVAQVVGMKRGRAELEAFLSSRLADLEPDDNLQWLLGLPWRAIFTTNYDRLIQRCYELNADPVQQPVTMSITSDLVDTNPRFEVPIYHLHGSLYEGGRSPVVLTEDDYSRFDTRRRELFGALKQRWATNPILYVGYSHEDPNWRLIHAELRAEFEPKKLPSSWRVAPTTPALDREILASQNIETIDADLAEFAVVGMADLGTGRIDPKQWSTFEEKVPPDLLKAFESSPAGVARLLNSWCYVNQEDFAGDPNIASYLQGNLPNWSLVGGQLPFERDVEQPILDELEDFATAPKVTQPVLLVQGPAGYGITTTLMYLAAQLVTERAGRVFFLRLGRDLLPADIEFACSLFQEPTFFVVDNAANVVHAVFPIIQRLRETHISACFLLGERLNEWGQRRPRISPQRFEIGPLSEGEIDRLLGYLEEHSALGVLEGLSDELRIAAIREKHQKELLVAMREATEGEQFDAILENEFRGIEDDFASRLYAAVCGFYRIRSLARDQVIANMMGCSVVEMYERSRDATEGVVIWDCVDEANEIYAARARHHVIAEVVWHRVLSAGERDSFIRRALSALNLNFPIDARAFEHFVRTDSAVGSIDSFDGKVEFFEVACKKDPLSPYVRQHYGRMLRREGKPELALAETERGLELSPDALVLHHTRGLILADLARQADSLDLGRRWLVQAEEAFRRALAIYPRDGHAFESLARLFFDWAKKVEGDEGATYVNRAEEVISEGLTKVADREYLFVVSSDIEDWLGNNKEAFWKLEHAVLSTPGAIHSRLILGRRYRKNGAFQEAIDVLHDVVKNHPFQFRASIEYALSLHRLDRPYSECISVLRLSTLHGLSDPRFVATLGGFLFINREFSEAAKVFEENTKQRFSLAERQRVEFVPHAPGESIPIRLKGTVTHVSAGYAFIDVPGQPSAFCPGSKFGSILMTKDKQIFFHLGFSARGAVALDPSEE